MEMSPLTCLLFFYLLYKTSGLHVSVRLYSEVTEDVKI